MRTRCLYSILFYLIISGCSQTIDLQSEKTDLLRIDSTFSALSETVNIKNAYNAFLDEKGVIMVSNEAPIVGKENIPRFKIDNITNTDKMKRKTSYAGISSSGDLGYTYGLIQFNNSDTISFGTYVTIWKKNKQGEWKITLDNCNNLIRK